MRKLKPKIEQYACLVSCCSKVSTCKLHQNAESLLRMLRVLIIDIELIRAFNAGQAMTKPVDDALDRIRKFIEAGIANAGGKLI